MSADVNKKGSAAGRQLKTATISSVLGLLAMLTACQTFDIGTTRDAGRRRDASAALDGPRGASDASPVANDADANLPADLPDLGGAVGLKRLIGPVAFGFGGADSQYGALALASKQVSGTWEDVDYEGQSRFAAVEPDGTTRVRSKRVGELSDTATFPTLAALGDDTVALLEVQHHKPKAILRYLQLDEQGVSRGDAVELASRSGGFLTRPVVAVGLDGVAVGFTEHASGATGALQLGMIDRTGRVLRAFKPLVAGKQSRHLDLVNTPSGFFAAWDQQLPGDCWAVMAAPLERSLASIPPPAPVEVFSGGGCYNRPAVAWIAGRALVCAERIETDRDAVVVCRTVAPAGSSANDRLGPITVSSVPALSAFRPTLVVGGGRVAMFFTARATGVEEVHARLYGADGQPLGETQRISEDGVRSWSPSAVWTGDSFFAAWFRYVPITVYYAGYRFAVTPL